jgi:hypothetical protein
MDSKSENNLNVIDLEKETSLFTSETKSSGSKPITSIKNTLEKNRRKEIRIRLFNHRFHHQNHVRLENENFSSEMSSNQIEVKPNSSLIDYLPCCKMQ